MSTIIAGENMDLAAFLSVENDQPLGICVFHKYGGEHIPLDDFFNESLPELGKDIRIRYAEAFENFSKRLRTEI